MRGVGTTVRLHGLSAGLCAKGMSCYPTGDGDAGRCRLDGPSVPGGTCEAVDACSEHSVCIASRSVRRVVRACARAGAPNPGCTCVSASGVDFRVCREDVEAGRSR